MVKQLIHFSCQNYCVKMNSKEPTIFDMAYTGKTAAVKILLNENEKLKTQIDNNGRMLIHWASLGGHPDLVQYLLSLDVPIDPIDDMDMTPLILAASAGRDAVVNILLKNDANVNAKTTEGHSALQYAASKNWRSICEELIKKGADINITDKRGATPLHRAASKGNLKIVQFLLGCGKSINIDQTDMYGNSALHLACDEDRQEEAKLLVSNGANVGLTNKERKSPLDLSSLGLARELKNISDARAANHQ